MNEDGYKKLFKDKPHMQALAWDKAWEVRNFEIQMYWKRATYFWAFQAASFAGYISLIRDVGTKSEWIVYLISNIGLIGALVWHFVNKGSKRWQENWEAHIDMLEKEISGPLYKTIISKEGESCYSVSRLNDIISFSFVLSWIGLSLHFLSSNNLLNFPSGEPDCFVIGSTVFTVILVGVVSLSKKTNFNEAKYQIQSREYTVV